ncbi:hypothetical protein CCACVL1_30202 [Corchorus capsularis]|uniref:Uncharacterized protein n=1 Tax=Corchorus capsularis TaxID=210143 RepID=A0A1R3FYE9_COCAP|nr:hypothetical protein CCACVL1_30202 [Corchorus capsularis]
MGQQMAWKVLTLVDQEEGIEIDDFIEISADLVQPLEDFFNNVFVMVIFDMCYSSV